MRTRTKVLSAIAAALVCGVAAYTVFFRVTLRKAYGELPQAVIAHAAGAIDGNRLTNSLEALEHAIACGVRFIELDLRMNLRRTLSLRYTTRGTDLRTVTGMWSDPWYTGDFEATYQDVVAGCSGLLRFLGFSC